tara:strand:+ start:718 stop:960 length:243 start_codon:yes stop_codon:yes gene_type:complete
MTDLTADLEFVTDGRGTGCRIVSDLAFFDEVRDGESADGCVIEFDHPLAYLEDEEILEIAERIKAYQAAIAKAPGQEETA